MKRCERLGTDSMKRYQFNLDAACALIGGKGASGFLGVMRDCKGEGVGLCGEDRERAEVGHLPIRPSLKNASRCA